MKHVAVLAVLGMGITPAPIAAAGDAPSDRDCPTCSRPTSDGNSEAAEEATAEDALDPAAPPSVDCDRAFPEYADGRQVTDFEAYGALVTNDLIAFLGRRDEETPVAKQLADVAEKGYQSQKLKRALLSNKALRAGFQRCRSLVGKTPLYFVPDDERSKDDFGPKFIGEEFRFVLGCGLPSDKAVLMMLRGTGMNVGLDGTVITDDVSFVRSSRSACWNDKDDPVQRCCGLRLSGMPAKLKDVIEDEFGKSINVRWRWRGFGDQVKGGLGAIGGDLRFGVYRMTVRAPAEVELQFIDSDGAVLWKAK